jgi:uncharacterized lipoprotein YajG
MRRTLAVLTATSIALLAGCSTPVDPGDKEACTVWAEAEKAMLQTVAVIVEVSKNPNNLADDIVSEFNKGRNELLAAYDQATKLATSPDLKSALEKALDADSIIYYDLAGATTERMQASIAAVGTVVSTCLVAGIDVSSVLGTAG